MLLATVMNRIAWRHWPFLALIAAAVLVTAAGERPMPSAQAKDGGDDGGGGSGGGNSGSGGSGSSGSGGNSGSGGSGGGGSSGSGGGGSSGGSGSSGSGSGASGGGGYGHGYGGEAGRERGRDDGGRSDVDRAGKATAERAREAVARGWALSLGSVLPTVQAAVPGRVLDVDLRQSRTGEWQYEFLVLARDRRYRDVVVDARRNQVVQVKTR